jgi:benzoyl-CoA-dihydrodiol lyase
MLIDDGSSAVSLPELPLLAVLPGTGGPRASPTSARCVAIRRRVLHYREGVKGKRAVERLVDEVVPGRVGQTVGARARNSRANRAARRRQGLGKPLHSRRRSETLSGQDISVELQRAERLASIALLRPMLRRPPDRRDDGARRGFWPLRLARELDDAILDIRINELDVATVVSRPPRSRASLAYEEFLRRTRELAGA